MVVSSLIDIGCFNLLIIDIVFFCADDVLELLYQHHAQSADFTCGIDYWKPKLAYYDTWVGRSMSGNLLTEFLMDSMFPNDVADRQRFLKGFPLQVGPSCHFLVQTQKLMALP